MINFLSNVQTNSFENGSVLILKTVTICKWFIRLNQEHRDHITAHYWSDASLMEADSRVIRKEHKTPIKCCFSEETIG